MKSKLKPRIRNDLLEKILSQLGSLEVDHIPERLSPGDVIALTLPDDMVLEFRVVRPIEAKDWHRLGLSGLVLSRWLRYVV